MDQEIQELYNGIRVLAEETGIPEDQLWNMRPSELQPLFDFAKIKVRLRAETYQKELDRLKAEERAWLDAHPLWRAHIEAKRA